MPRRVPADLLAHGGVVAAALVLRLIDLGSRPFHHDESQDAYFSWVLLTSGEYEYDPLLHGPLRFYLTAGLFALLGDTDVTARLAPALMGAALVAGPAFLREQLGRAGALVAAAGLAAGPSFLYFSRFAREDIYVAALTMGLIVVLLRALARPHPAHPALLGALLAASFATKETTFITVFVGGSFLLLEAARERRAPPRAPRPVLEAVRALPARAWGWGAAAFAATFALLFTTFLTNPGGLWDGIYTGLAYWLGQHEVGRGGEAWFFYGVLLLGEEWPVLGLGLVGAVAAARRRSVPLLFLAWGFALSLAVYSWAGEKFAWLVLHPLLPLVLLAGAGAQVLWDHRRRALGRAGLALALAGAVYLGAASWWASAEHGADPRELLVSTQSSRAVPAVAERVRAEAGRVRREEDREPVLLVDASEGATFPWAWYLRDEPVLYADLAAGAAPPWPVDAAILTEAGRARLAGRLGPAAGRRFPFRVWWVRDYGAITPASWWAWLTRREPWSPTGGMPEWLVLS